LLSGNLATVTARSFSVPEGVGSGRFGIGLVIDFLAQSRNRPGIEFRYGHPVFPVPAGIAGLKGGENAAAAELFLNFVLSLDGQKLLLLPGINRLPVSRTLHSDHALKASGLLSLTEQNGLQPYNVQLSRKRYQLVNQLFDRMITFRLRERRHLWKRMIDLEKRFGGKDPTIVALRTTVIKQLGAVPVSYVQSQNPSLHEMIKTVSTEASLNKAQRKIFKEWDIFVSRKFSRVTDLLDQAERSFSTEKRR
jgi:hypothetical protein